MALFSIAGVAGALGVAQTSFIAVGAAAGLNAAVGIGLNKLAVKLAGNDVSSSDLSHKGTLRRGADLPMALLFGMAATGGSLEYANEWAGDGETPNAFYSAVISLADIPIRSLDALWVNGERGTVAEIPHPLFGHPIEEFHQDGSDHVWVHFYDGTQTEACDMLVNHVSTEERPWDATAIGVGTAYAVVTVKGRRELFSGFPEFMPECTGHKLYDPSRDSSVGGVGDQRWDDPSTWGGDGDHLPAVQIYNLLRGMRYNGDWVYGMQALSAAQLPASHWIAQINKCRAEIAAQGGMEPTYRAGGEIPVGTKLADAINALLDACQGRLSEAGGTYKLYVGAPDAPVMSFEDGDILSTEEQRFTPFFGLADTVNGINAKFPDPRQAWQIETAPPLIRGDLEAKDGGRRIMVDIDFDLVPYGEQVQRLMQSGLNEARRARRHTFTLPPRFWPLEPGDIVSWVSPRNGYAGKLFRVDGVMDQPNGNVVIDLTEVDPSDHGFDTNTDYVPVFPGSVGNSPVPAQPITSWSAEPWSILDANGVSRLPAILVRWNAGVDDVEAVRVQVRIAGPETLVFDGRVENVASGQGVVSQAILSKTPYEVRGQYVPATPRETEWSDWLPVTTGDYRITASDIVDELNEKINVAFDRHDQALETVKSGAVFDLLKDSRITDAILAAQAVNENARQAVNFEENEENRAAILQEQTERLDGDDALAELITLLTTRVGTAESDLSIERQARIDGDTASASDRAALLTRIEGNEAGLVTEGQTRAAQDAVNASLSAALGVRMDGAEGNISNLFATKVDATGAVSAVETEIGATYGSLSAMVSATFFAEAHANRVNAGYVLRLNGSNVFEVVSSQDGTSGPTQTFRLGSDYVQITGLTQIDSAVVALLAADSAFISNLLVDTLQIAGNAVTIPTSGISSNLTGNGNWQSMVNIAINLPVQADVLLLWSIEQGYAGTIPTWGYQIRDNVSGTIYDEREGMTFGNDQPSGQWLLLNQSAGTFRAQLRWKGQNSNISGLGALTVLVVKR